MRRLNRGWASCNAIALRVMKVTLRMVDDVADDVDDDAVRADEGDVLCRNPTRA